MTAERTPTPSGASNTESREGAENQTFSEVLIPGHLSYLESVLGVDSIDNTVDGLESLLRENTEDVLTALMLELNQMDIAAVIRGAEETLESSSSSRAAEQLMLAKRTLEPKRVLVRLISPYVQNLTDPGRQRLTQLQEALNEENPDSYMTEIARVEGKIEQARAAAKQRQAEILALRDKRSE